MGLMGTLAAAQAVVVDPMADSSSASASVLVDALLSPSSGLSLVTGSAQYTGQASASGTFSAGGTGPTGLGINNGVVLTTGDARFIGSSAAFPFDSANKSGGYTAGFGNSLTENTSPGNALLGTLTAAPTANASALSFQFIPQGSSLKLTFVFGSEDYNDLVNSGFPTDVFAIFVNGINYALVPGTGLPVSAATINCGGPTSGPASNVGPQSCALFRDNAPFFDSIDSEVDGFTVPLDITVPVNGGTINSIFIGIADSLDTAGDSAVLLAAGSVTAIPEPSSMALMLVGTYSLALVLRRKQSWNQKAKNSRR
jgi:hypothetical protein